MNSNQISSSSETSIKEEVKTIPYERFENYRVQIDGENWFEVNGMIFISKVRVVNIRSVHGHIDGKDFDRSIMDKEITDYLRTQTNVELINILSRQYNQDNWFDVYEDVKEDGLDQWRRKEILSSYEHPVVTGCRYKRNLISQASSGNANLKPNEIYETSHFLRKDTKYEAFPCIPIYHINGSRYARASTTEHLVHFDILIHLLMKKFVSFKSKILHLAGIEVQVAQGRGKSIQEYMNMKNSELVQIIMRQQELNKTRDKRIKAQRHKITGLERQIMEMRKDFNERFDAQTHELHEANNRLQDVQHHVHDIHERITGHMEELNRSARFINEHFHSNNTTFAAINECITIFPSQDLINNWPNEIRENEIIYDVFAGNNSRAYQRSSMFKPNRAYHITNEEFEDGLRLHSIQCADGKDLLKYVRTHMPRHLGYFHPDSKLITSDLERVKEYIRGSVDIMLQRNKQTVVHSLDEIRNAITREFEERFGQLEEHIHDEIHDVIEPIRDEINEIVNEELQAIRDVHEEQVQMHNDIEVIQNQIQKHANHMEEQINQLNQQIQQLTMREQLLNTYPGIQTEYLEGYINKRYRTFRIDDEGKIWYQPYAGARDIELTLDQLQNIILRDRAGHKYRNGQML